MCAALQQLCIYPSFYRFAAPGMHTSPGWHPLDGHYQRVQALPLSACAGPSELARKAMDSRGPFFHHIRELRQLEAATNMKTFPVMLRHRIDLRLWRLPCASQSYDEHTSSCFVRLVNSACSSSCPPCLPAGLAPC